MQTLHGIAGFIGVSSFTLVVTLAILGLIGVLFELHVIPGNGFSGVLGALALLCAVSLAFGAQPLFMTLQALGIALLCSTVLLCAMLKIWPKSGFFRRLTLTDAQGAGYVAGSDYMRLLGCAGRAVSSLRPAGVADIEGERIDVLTEGDFIEAGTPVRVSRVEGRRIFVKSLTKEQA